MFKRHFPALDMIIAGCISIQSGDNKEGAMLLAKASKHESFEDSLIALSEINDKAFEMDKESNDDDLAAALAAAIEDMDEETEEEDMEEESEVSEDEDMDEETEEEEYVEDEDEELSSLVKANLKKLRSKKSK